MDVRYKIDNVSARPTFTGNGRPIDVYDVFFTEASSGYSGQVSIPLAEYSAEKVDAAVRPIAEQLALTASLGQG